MNQNFEKQLQQDLYEYGSILFGDSGYALTTEQVNWAERMEGSFIGLGTKVRIKFCFSFRFI